ncbi:hypothetical protein K9L16_00565 [Candidatus Pacearchaeota archaeon]|nr:hypothetical protein [Candidatus Pacearchaeota archaeon]
MDFIIIFLGIILLIALILAFWLGKKFGSLVSDRFWEGELGRHRKDAIAKSRAVLSGNFSEQLAPFLPKFPYSPTECRFIGKPIDFLVFKGMDKKEIEEVVFVEVKSGKSQLSSSEKKLKNAIQRKKVSWKEYRVPEDLTNFEEKSEEEV